MRAEADRSLGRRRQRAPAIARPHFGIRFGFPPRDGAEAVKINGTSHWPVGQLADVQPQEVDPVDCLSLQIEAQGQVVAVLRV